MSDTVFVLTRTSGRKDSFARARESVLALTWPRVVHIVHSDDPRDTYVDGDIVIRGEVYPPFMGSAPYNLYCNRLLDAIPYDGWVAFLDDDDVYAAPDVFERLLADGDKSVMHTGQADRGNGKVWNTEPKEDKAKRVYQTECFCLWSTKARKAKWWGDKSGDHYYTRRLTREVKTRWHNVLIACAQDGKGRGERTDEPQKLPPNKRVALKVFERRQGRRNPGKCIEMPYHEAVILEKHGVGRITHKGVTVSSNIKTPSR